MDITYKERQLKPPDIPPPIKPPTKGKPALPSAGILDRIKISKNGKIARGQT